MNVAEVFRYMLTKKAIPDKVISENQFVFKTVFYYKSGPSYCCCRCAYDHEYFSYISDCDDVDMVIFDRLATAVTDGYCQHATGLIEKGYLRETRVNVFHIAAALGSEELMDTLISGLHNETINVSIIHTGLFKLHPFDIATIKGNVIVSRLLSNIHLLHGLKRTWDYPFITYASEKGQSNVLHVESIPLLQLCITKRDLPMLELLFKILERSRWLALGPRMIILLFQNNLTDLLYVILEIIMTEHEHLSGLNTTKSGIEPDVMFEDVSIIAELAVIYNQRDIFEKSLQLLSEGGTTYLLTKWCEIGHPVTGACKAFKRQDFYKSLLQKAGKNFNKTFSTSNVSNFLYLYSLLKRFNFLIENIKHALEQLPDIGEIINVPFDITSCRDATSVGVYKGLTPIQSYVFGHGRFTSIEPSVVRLLIELGADIDKEYPQEELLSSSLRHMATLCEGQSLPLCVCILEENTRSKLEGRSFLELLLYENVSISVNKSVVALGLKHYKNEVLTDNLDCSIGRVDISEDIEPGSYLMDTNLHESALDFAVPLLIEAGFHYTCAEIDEALRLSNDLGEEKERLQQRVREMRSPHPLEKNYVQAYLQRCVSEPRSLKLGCRDVLRTYFPRRQIHRFLSKVDIPRKIKDFLLLKPILQTLPDDI